MALKGAAFWRFVQRIGKLISDLTSVDGQKNYRSIKPSDLATADGQKDYRGLLNAR